MAKKAQPINIEIKIQQTSNKLDELIEYYVDKLIKSESEFTKL